jgi:hypothetical protein
MSRTFRKNNQKHEQKYFVDDWAYGSKDVYSYGGYNVDWETSCKQMRENPYYRIRARFIGKTNDQMFAYLLAKFKGDKHKNWNKYEHAKKFAINACYRSRMRDRLHHAIMNDEEVFVDDTWKDMVCSYSWD